MIDNRMVPRSPGRLMAREPELWHTHTQTGAAPTLIVSMAVALHIVWFKPFMRDGRGSLLEPSTGAYHVSVSDDVAELVRESPLTR